MKVIILILVFCSFNCFGQSKSIKELFILVKDSAKIEKTIQFFNLSRNSSFQFLEFIPGQKLYEQTPKSFWKISRDSLDRIAQIGLYDSINHLRNFSLRVYRTGDLSILYGRYIDRRESMIDEHKILENGEEVMTIREFPTQIDGFLVVDHKGKRLFFFETYEYLEESYSANNISIISGIMLLDENLFPVKRIDICNRKIKDITEYTYSASRVTENRHLLNESESEKLGLLDDLTLNDVYGILKRKVKKVDEVATITEDKDKIGAPLWLFMKYSDRYYDKSECWKLND